MGRIHAKGERGTGRRVARPEEENGVTEMVENAMSQMVGEMGQQKNVSHLMLLVASVILFHSNLI